MSRAALHIVGASVVIFLLFLAGAFLYFRPQTPTPQQNARDQRAPTLRDQFRQRWAKRSADLNAYPEDHQRPYYLGYTYGYERELVRMGHSLQLLSDAEHNELEEHLRRPESQQYEDTIGDGVCAGRLDAWGRQQYHNTNSGPSGSAP